MTTHPLLQCFQFQRLANVYFLLICILCSISVISPIGPASTVMGLAFVLMVTMIKDALEDHKRVRSDEEANTRPCRRFNVHQKQWEHQVPWAELMMGDLIRIDENEIVPADVLVVASTKFDETSPEAAANSNGAVSVNTKGLDGETVLKMRQAQVKELRETVWKQQTMDAVQLQIRAVECEAPNGELDSLNGNVVLSDGSKVPVNRNGFLLRGVVVEQTR